MTGPQSSVSHNDYTLHGKRLTLERVGPEHVDFVLGSFKNRGFWRHYRANQSRKLTRQQLLDGLQKETQVTPEKLKKLEWLVFNVSGEEKIPIGFACLADYSPVGKKAEFLVGIIDPGARAHGIALEASLLVMEFAFNVAGLHKLVSFVYAANRLAQDNTLALGFSQEGLLREHIYDKPNDSYIDVFQNGLLAREFRANERLSKLSSRLLGRDVTQPPALPTRKPKDSDWTISTSINYS